MCVEIKGTLKFLGNAVEQVGQTAVSEEVLFVVCHLVQRNSQYLYQTV